MNVWIVRRIAGAARCLAGLNPVEWGVGAFVVVAAAVIFLPWLQQARDQARVVQTKNNLRRIGTAVFGYVDTHRSLPVGGRIPVEFHTDDPGGREAADDAVPPKASSE